MAELNEDERQWHRNQAAKLFNLVWDYMGKAERTAAEDDTILNAAHASRYHWELVGDQQNLSIGEWQISRVYALLGRAEPATYHGKRCLEHTEAGDLEPFYFGYAHEALARAAKVAGDRAKAAAHHALALAQAARVTEKDDRDALEADLATIL
jgi:hypothetical protein